MKNKNTLIFTISIVSLIVISFISLIFGSKILNITDIFDVVRILNNANVGSTKIIEANTLKLGSAYSPKVLLFAIAITAVNPKHNVMNITYIGNLIIFLS